MPTAKRKHALAQAEVVIPEKIYFRIGEVSALAKLPTYVLRFWETEFPQLRPTKSSTGQRMYRRKDVEFVMQIRKLLYEDGFTIAGARERLREEARGHRSQNPSANPVPEPSRRPGCGWRRGTDRRPDCPFPCRPSANFAKKSYRGCASNSAKCSNCSPEFSPCTRWLPGLPAIVR